ncbi:hypothetical protein [Microbacterium sp. NPDC087589]|uniref:hypothetical protein n=1 Tax=Microbacterium sp. NPDC087589 TaxID=3364191 RepID=UPI0037FFE78F
MVKSSAPYADYTVRVGDVLPVDVYYDEGLAGEPLRVHHRVSRTPSRREFVIRPLRGATAADRAELAHELRDIRRVFRRCELARATNRVWNRAGRFWLFTIYLGTRIEDPLVQLELEMMIDIEYESRHERAA